MDTRISIENKTNTFFNCFSKATCSIDGLGRITYIRTASGKDINIDYYNDKSTIENLINELFDTNILPELYTDEIITNRTIGDISITRFNEEFEYFEIVVDEGFIFTIMSECGSNIHVTKISTYHNGTSVNEYTYVYNKDYILKEIIQSKE